MRAAPDVRPGQVWRNCDPRMNGQRRMVVRVEDGKAVMAAEGGDSKSRRTRVAIARMYPHSSGWELIHE